MSHIGQLGSEVEGFALFGTSENLHQSAQRSPKIIATLATNLKRAKKFYFSKSIARKNLKRKNENNL
jgi:hypothetical protein